MDPKDVLEEARKECHNAVGSPPSESAPKTPDVAIIFWRWLPRDPHEEIFAVVSRIRNLISSSQYRSKIELHFFESNRNENKRHNVQRSAESIEKTAMSTQFHLLIS